MALCPIRIPPKRCDHPPNDSSHLPPIPLRPGVVKQSISTDSRPEIEVMPEIGFMLNGVRATSEVLNYSPDLSRSMDRLDDSYSGWSSISDLLTPSSICSRRSSMKSLESDLHALFGDDISEYDNEEDYQALLAATVLGAPSINVRMVTDFISNWQDTLFQIFEGNAVATNNFEYFTELARCPVPSCVGDITELLNGMINIVVNTLTKKYSHNILELVSQIRGPLELQLLKDMVKIKMYLIRSIPMDIREHDIVGCMIRKRINNRPVHIQVYDDNFTEKLKMTKIDGFRFYIVQIKEKNFILKPENKYGGQDLVRENKIPTMLVSLGINYKDGHFLERNMIVRELYRFLKMDKSCPEVCYVSFKGKRYVAVEILDGIPQIEFPKKDRIQIYKNDQVLKDLFTKQLVDCIIGNCDANPSNILINLEGLPVIGNIDHDISLSSNFTELENIYCIINNSKSPYLRALVRKGSHFKGAPKFIDTQIRGLLMNINPWAYFSTLLCLQNEGEIQTNLNRFVRMKEKIERDELITVEDWGAAYREIKIMDQQTRSQQTYLI